MKAADIKPGAYYRVRLSGGEYDDTVRAERVELAYPTQTDTRTQVMVGIRHFALGDITTRHMLRDVLGPSDPARVATVTRFLATRNEVLRGTDL